MIYRKICAFLTLLVLLFMVGCTTEEKDESLLLSLSFDEGTGSIVNDSSGNEDPANIRYSLLSGYAQDPIDPQWRNSAISGTSLQFDGYSTFVQYSYDDISLGGMNMTIEVWVAPRAFESNETGYREDGTEMLTAFVSQWTPDDNSGILLGMHREGYLSFQVGIGDRMFKVWADDELALSKYEWTKVTAVYDGDNGVMSIYVNGELAGEKSIFKGAEIVNAPGLPLYIGKNNYYSSVGSCARQMFSGLMDEVRIYDRALTSEEIKSNYDSQVPDGIPEIDFDDIWFDEDLLINDVNRPTYHIAAPQMWMNEAHAPFYYNGYYHLFYQFSPFGPYLQQPHWGHWISTDLVTWVNVEEALSPSGVAADGVWSGCAGYKDDGTPVLFFTSSNLDRAEGVISDQNVGIATPSDLSDPLLINWVMEDELAIIQMPGEGITMGFRDTSVWRIDDTWYMVVGSASDEHEGGTAQLYKTTDDSFMDWTYCGEFTDWVGSEAEYGHLWELPNVAPIKNEDGTDSGKYIFIFSPCPPASNDMVYMIGTFDTETDKFIPDPEYTTPKILDYGRNHFTGPSLFSDPVSGNLYLFSVSKDDLGSDGEYQSGWAGNAGLTREISLGENNELVIKAASTYVNLQGDTLFSMQNATMDQVNQGIQAAAAGGNTIRIKLTIRNVDATKFGVYVRQSEDKSEYTQIYWSDGLAAMNSGMSGRNGGLFEGAVALDDGVMEFDIFLDRSMIDIFFNSSKTITGRLFSDLSSVGIELFAEGGEVYILNCEIYEMNSIYEGLEG